HHLAPRGDYNDPVLAGAPIRHEFGYTPTGFLAEEVFAANTAAPRRYRYGRDAEGKITLDEDPAGTQVVRRYDERGLTLREDVLAPDGGLVRRRRFVYERTGELRAVAIELNGADGLAAGEGGR